MNSAGLVIISIYVVAVTTGLKIIPDVSELTITTKGDITLVCEHNEPVQWSYPSYERPENFQIEITQDVVNRTFVSHLTLRNATYLDTGYYYCNPKNNIDDKSANIYLYVFDDKNLLAVNESVTILSQNEFGDVVIPCKPTSPDVNISLTNDVGELMTNLSYDPKIGYVMKNPKVTDSCIVMCEATRDEMIDVHQFLIKVFPVKTEIARPHIDASGAYHLIKGDTAVLNCSITEELGITLYLDWIVPEPLKQGDRVSISHHNATRIKLDYGTTLLSHYRTLTITNISETDQGNYICKVKDHNNNEANASYFLNVFGQDMTFLDMYLEGSKELIIRAGVESIRWVVNVTGYPPPSIQWIDPSGKKMTPLSSNKYAISFDGRLAILKIYNVTIWDSGTYSINAVTKEHSKSINITLLVEDKPIVKLFNMFEYYTLGGTYTIACSVTAYPLPAIVWLSKKCNSYPQCEEPFFNGLPRSEYMELSKNQYQLQSEYVFNATQTTEFLCEASNAYGTANATSVFLVSDVKDGFAIEGPSVIAEGDNVTLLCGASLYSYSDNIAWYYNTKNGTDVALTKNTTDTTVFYNQTTFSYQSSLNIRNISKKANGTYKCEVSSLYKTDDNRQSTFQLDVKDIQPPFIKSDNTTMRGNTFEIATGKQVKFNCFVCGIPLPTITWFKDGKPFVWPNDSRIVLLQDDITEELLVKQSLLIKYTALNDDGIYTCYASNRVGNASVFEKLHLTDKPEKHEHVIFFFAFVVLVIALLICFILYWIKSQAAKKLKKDLAGTGLLNFEDGAVSSLNPELGIEDQADLLPYDRRWEFPREKLKLGKQLGSGAFGVVMKAEADGIIDQNTCTTVAVKMVKRGADSLYIKALASELKIMIHLGRHLNVVNLLGACTKHINKRELIVIVEFCRYGNLHDFLLKQRNNFINQINEKTGKLDITIHTLNKNVHYDEVPVSSNGTAITTLEETPIGSDGYLINKDAEPDWRSNYRGDYRNTTVKPITTTDLICWSFQIARGMEYLASRKVLHGDLAARNVLLADDNIVKICDFGLAKSMYNSENYQRRKHELLPVRWMAIESIRDRIFSTQSDVWSFGITLWELFSLSVTPYPGVEHLEVLYSKLVDGYRMEQPIFSTRGIYEIILDCWHSRPTQRPAFTELTERLGTMLEDSVRSHYTKLNEMYLRMNSELNNSVDYLSMMNPPVYTNSFETQPRYVNVPLAEQEDDVELKPMLYNTENNYVNLVKPVCFLNPSYADLPRVKNPSSYTHTQFTPTFV